MKLKEIMGAVAKLEQSTSENETSVYEYSKKLLFLAKYQNTVMDFIGDLMKRIAKVEQINAKLERRVESLEASSADRYDRFVPSEN